MSVQDLTVSFDGQSAILRQLSMSFPQQQITAVIGPSGSGKSTLLRCLNRLWEPPPTTVFLDHRDIIALDALDLRRRVGMVMQSTVLFPGTVADNLRYGPRQHGQSISQRRLRELMQMVGLDPNLLDRAADKLSGGQAQRVSIARTLANEPEVLLLDEPTRSLDPAATRILEETLGHLRDQLGLTIILVSHAIDQVKRIADLSALLIEGAIVEVGTPTHLFSEGYRYLTQSFAQGQIVGRDGFTEGKTDDHTH
jgi:ABC-type phosphate transport system ATPase subunit